MIKKIMYSLIVLGLIGGGIGFYMGNQPLKSTQSMQADYAMSPAELLSAFEQDETSANAKYLDKVIEVKGSVQKVEKKDEKTTIYLDADNLMSSIIFQLEENQSNITQGDEITLKGICTGYLMDVVLVRAVKV